MIVYTTEVLTYDKGIVPSLEAFHEDHEKRRLDVELKVEQILQRLKETFEQPTCSKLPAAALGQQSMVAARGRREWVHTTRPYIDVMVAWNLYFETSMSLIQKHGEERVRRVYDFVLSLFWERPSYFNFYSRGKGREEARLFYDGDAGVIYDFEKVKTAARNCAIAMIRSDLLIREDLAGPSYLAKWGGVA